MKSRAAIALVIAFSGIVIVTASVGVHLPNNETECVAGTTKNECRAPRSSESDPSDQTTNKVGERSLANSNSDCADSHELCSQWARDGQCGTNQRYMLHYCLKSCAVCGEDILDNPVDVEPCVDNHPKCARFKAFNECEQNPGYMLINCRKSCKACETSITSTIDFGVKQKEGGEHASQVLAVIRDSKKYMRKILSNPLYASARETCRNGNEMCSIWAASGECQNIPIMKLQCAPACQSCDMLNVALRCPMPDDNSEDAWKPGDMHKMFERIVDQSDESEHVNATIIQRPYKSGDMTERTWSLGPWFLSFDKFLSDEESDKLIAYGEQKGYGRSEEVTKNPKPDGSYEMLTSDYRTSHNTWCDEACQNDPVISNVIQRIAQVTSIPEQNSETLQLLKYEKGQRYGEHADYIPYQKDRPCGVRLLTLFIYLNDDFDGGETKFRFLHDMKIKPKKGKAVLWPNVLNDKPNEEDEMFDHEALPVESGVKYAANVWLHMRDFGSHIGNRCI